MNAKLFSNRKVSRRLKVSEASVRRIKKKIESGEELSPKRKKKCGRKPIFISRSERSLKKTCLENRFATTKMIKSQLQDINVNASGRTVRRKIKDLNFKIFRHARKPKLTLAMKANRLNWAKQWRDKDVDFWRSSSAARVPGRLDVVKGMMRQDQYKDVLQNRLIPKLEEWFSNGEPYVLMQNGAPCHTARSIKAFFGRTKYPYVGLDG
ncbi:uncharacterized protein TNCV_4100811 [Trichonephila clavipes]|nr:uncharacterized protein TNCV_4100811 [Trichonephila clavipes]